MGLIDRVTISGWLPGVLWNGRRCIATVSPVGGMVVCYVGVGVDTVVVGLMVVVRRLGSLVCRIGPG